MNELLFFSQLALIFGSTLGALRLGKEALITWIVLQSVLANLFVLKQTTLFSMQVTCSDGFMLGIVLGLNLLQEYFGRPAAKKAIFISFACMGIFALLAKLHLLFEPGPTDWAQSSYQNILSHSPRILIASLITFFIVQQFDVRFFGWLKNRFSTLHLTWRTTASLIFSQAIDTALFTMLGLYGVMDHLLSIMVMSFAIKVMIAFTSTPFTAISKKLMPTIPKSEGIA